MINGVKRIVQFVCLLGLMLQAKAQETTGPLPPSDSLKYLSDVLINSRDFEQRQEAAYLLTHKMEQFLRDPLNYTVSLDSFKAINCITPADKSFRIYTWMLPFPDGTYEYFGYIRLHPSSKAKEQLFQLIDSSSTIQRPEQVELTNKNWFGASYFRVIETKYKKSKYYTLFGWDGNTMNSTKKLIDVLSFDDEMQPVFGAPVFKVSEKGKMLHRIIFEYAEEATFALRYEQQHLRESGKKKLLIVFDHLLPINENLKGKAAFYVPATNLCDGFLFSKGQWVLVKDVDVRNPKTEEKKGRIEADLLPRK